VEGKGDSVLALVIAFLFGLVLMIPSVADVGRIMADGIYQAFPQTERMTESYHNTLALLFWSGLAIDIVTGLAIFTAVQQEKWA